MNDAWRVKERHETEAEENVPNPPALTSVNTIRECLENLDFYFQTKRGSRGHPLAYVTRADEAVPAIANDLGYGLPDHDSELIRRGDHTAHHFAADNVLVWGVIRTVTHEGPAWSWVMRFSQTRDGRQAYLSLRAHYLGDATQGRIRTRADMLIARTFFDGRSRNFNFERYGETLKKAFEDLRETGETVPDDRQVRILLNGIRDSRLTSAVNTILSTPALRSDFDRALNHMAQSLDMQTSTSEVTSRRVNALETRSSGGRGRNQTG